MSVSKHDFNTPGKVSLWATTRALQGVHHDFLEGCDQLFMWLMVDYDVAIDGAFATNFTKDGSVQPLDELLFDLHASGSFSARAVERAKERGIAEASFVVALYDYAYDPAAVGLPEEARGSEWLAYVGTFAFEE